MADTFEAARVALVAILDQRQVPIGVGCLVEGSMVITCAHVVAEALGDSTSQFDPKPPEGTIGCLFAVAAQTPSKASVHRWLPARPDFEIPVDGRADIAVLMLDGAPPPGTKPLFFDQPTSPWNQNFVAVGFPEGLRHDVTTRGMTQGNVLSCWVQVETRDDAKYPLQRGFSGGPAILEGCFGGAGIIAVIDRDTRGAGWLIPASVLLDVLRSAEEAPTHGPVLPRYGRLYRSPGLPSFYVDRPELIGALKRVLLDTDRAVAVPARGQTIGLLGMGGVGKTVLAARLIEDPEVRQVCTDGLYWVTLGESANIVAVLGQLVEDFTDTPTFFTTVEEGTRALAQAIAGRKILLVLDDVWQLEHVTPFRGLRPPARLVVTTRVSQIVSALDAQRFAVDVLDDSQAVVLLRERAGAASVALLNTDPSLRDQLLRATGGLPLSLAMVASMVGESGVAWGAVVEALQKSRLDLIAAQLPGYERYGTLYDAVGSSVAHLPAIERERYLDLAVFPRDRPIALNALRLLWLGPAGLEAETLRLAKRFVERSLANWTGDGMLRLHDLQMSFVVAMVDKEKGRLAEMHRRLVLAYEAACNRRFHRLKNDGHVFDLLPWHMQRAGMGRSLSKLLLDFDWLAAKLVATRSPFGVWRDLSAFGDSPVHKDVEQTLRHSAASLARNPALLAQQLWGRLDPQEQPTIQNLLTKARTNAPRPSLLPRRPTLRERTAALRHVLEGHSVAVNVAVLTSDGQRAVSGADDGTLMVWDVEAGVLLWHLKGHVGPVHIVVLTSNGRRAISAARTDVAIKVWDIENGTLLRNLEGNTAGVHSIALTADGRRLVSASDERVLRVWDIEGGAPVCALEGHDQRIRAIAITPDGRRAVSASDDSYRANYTWKLWDIEAGHLLHDHNVADGGSVCAIALSTDGRRVVIASHNRFFPHPKLRMWDVETGISNEVEIQDDDVRVLVLTASGQRVISGANSLEVWDVETGAPPRKLVAHSGPIRAVALAADGRRAISASDDRTLKVWDLESGMVVDSLEGHESSVCGVALGDDGRRAVSASTDGTLRVWDIDSGSIVRQVDRYNDPIRAVALTAEGQCAISASKNSMLNIWDIQLGRLLHRLEGHEGDFVSVALTADGRRAVSGSFGRMEDLLDIHLWQNALKVWDVKGGKLLRSLEVCEGGVLAVALATHGRLAISAHAGGALNVWSIKTGRLIHSLREDESRILAVALNANGRRAVSTHSDGSLRVWDIKFGRLLCRLGGRRQVAYAVALTANGGRAVSGRADGTVNVWDLDGRRLLHSLRGHRGAIRSVALVEEDQRAISVSRDGRLQVWHVESGARLHTIDGIVRLVALTTTGRRAVSISANRTLELWDIEAGTMLCEFIGSSSITAGAFDSRGSVVVCGDGLGRIHVLDLVE